MENSGVDLWKKAKKIIPGGNQLLSKRSEMFLPDLWPSYYKKAKGCEVWDMDDNHYYDFAQMGVGSCTLGYANDYINQLVINAIENGAMCSLNSYEEVELAERLIALHPWADMARFARTGGEACSIAIRIARAATNRSKVAFCGYHGWHDWYISANIGSSTNLDEQLLPGLKPSGVPRELYNTAIPFNYNSLAELNDIVDKYGSDIAAIIMEPQRGISPTKEFLEGVRCITSKIGAVLIFDEVTSGFRVNIGGIHKTMGINPDIAVFGKALGNGFPISAIIGRREVMDSAQNSFISSTFWTERIGYVAALASLDYMEKMNSPSLLIKWGNHINECWRATANENNIEIHISGISPLTHLEFVHPEKLALQTLYAQLMLEDGFLLGASVYSTTAYNDEIIKKFEKSTHKSFEMLSDAIKHHNIKNQLLGEIKHTGFKRLVD